MKDTTPLHNSAIYLTTKGKPADRTDDPFLVEKMCAELEGILLWCLEGLHRLVQNDFRFTVSERAAANVDTIKRSSNEQLIGEAIRGKRDQVFLASKFGIVRDPANPAFRGVNGHPDYIHQAIDGSLKRLGVETLDLYYQHRMDPNVPIEETVGAMAELVRAGKVRYLGLSEASAATLERAHKVHPISALQVNIRCGAATRKVMAALRLVVDWGSPLYPTARWGGGF